MTQLFINGFECDLPTDFKITLVTENVFFSKASTYTYDVKLSCAPYSQNAKIFAHCYRPDKTVSPSPMPAQLIVDNRVILNGTAIIVGTDNDTVSVQLLQGNSELNWKSKYEKVYINELDLGTAEQWGFQKSQGYDPDYLFLKADLASQYDNHTFWKADCVYNYTDGMVTVSPVINSETEELMNCLSLFDDNLILHEFDSNEYQSNVILPTRLAPQPRLWYMVEKVFEAVGLTIGKFELRELDIFNDAFIANSTEIWLIADILPKITFVEFVEQLQIVYNCVVVINNGKADILLRDRYYGTDTPQNIEQVTEVVDEFSRDVDADAEVADADKARQYDISYSDFGKHFLGDDFAAVPIYPASKLSSTPNPYVFAFTEYGNKVSSPFLLPNNKIDGYVVDYFRASESPNGTDKAIMKLVPTVPFDQKNLTDALDGYWNADFRDLAVLVTAIAATAYGTESLIAGRENIQELIDAGETPSAKGSLEKMPISYLAKVHISDHVYQELWDFTYYYLTPKYVAYDFQQYQTYFNGYVPSARRSYYIDVVFDSCPYDMSLFPIADDQVINYYSVFYKEKANIPTTEQYTFQFVTNRLLAVESKFNILNQRYVALQIKYTIGPRGFEKIAEGEFYKL